MHRDKNKQVQIYTDGACSGNPGPGGYGVILVYKGRRKELSGGFSRTTNNRMELTGLIVALASLKEPCAVTIHTDSKYLMGGFEKNWVRKWKANGWLTSAREPVQNKDLWMRLDSLLAIHSHSFCWVKGHADNGENNRCDELAVEACRKRDLYRDEGYEALLLAKT